MTIDDRSIVATDEATWREELAHIVSMMRDVSLQSDPQEAAKLYSERLRGIVPSDGWIGVSRRNLAAPEYRITRSTIWKQAINPWKEAGKLPRFSTGILGELLYSNEPAVIHDLPARLKADDPAHEHLTGYELLITLPQFENGEAINMGVVLVKETASFPMHKIPIMVWQANLWGRSVLNSVLRQDLKTAYDELDRELKVVGKIQRSLLPETAPAIPHVNIATHYRTSARAGGDYYDFFPLSRDRWGLFIADVSGHGTPAAVMMAVTHAIAHSQVGELTPAGRVLAFINERLTNVYTRGEGTFVTGFYGIFEPKRRRLTYSLAGHPGPRLARKGEVIALEGDPGLPLGLEPDEKYPEVTMELEAGDSLVLFTDGIVEAFNPAGDQYAVERLDAVCREHATTCEGLVAAILADLEAFSGGAAPSDDQTLVVVRLQDEGAGKPANNEKGQDS